MNLRKALLAIGLMLGLAVLSAPLALAHDTTTTFTCPTSATFPVVVPPIPQLRLAGGIGAIVTQEHPTGEEGQCAGTFVVSVGGIPVASGTLVAEHDGLEVSAIFSGTIARGLGAFTGSLSFDGSTGTVTVEITTAAGCVRVTTPFSAAVGTFVPGLPSFRTCGENDNSNEDDDD